MYPYDRRSYRRQNPLRGLAGGIFIIFLALAFFIGGTGSKLFLPLLFVGLAFCALITSVSTFNPRSIYSGLMGFVWLLGIGVCFIVGFWPWILVLVGISMILGALFRPITAGLLGAGFLLANQQQQQPPFQPAYPAPQQPPPGTYQEGGNVYPYPPEQQPSASPTPAPPTTPLDSQS